VEGVGNRCRPRAGRPPPGRGSERLKSTPTRDLSTPPAGPSRGPKSMPTGGRSTPAGGSVGRSEIDADDGPTTARSTPAGGSVEGSEIDADQGPVDPPRGFLEGWKIDADHGPIDPARGSVQAPEIDGDDRLIEPGARVRRGVRNRCRRGAGRPRRRVRSGGPEIDTDHGPVDPPAGPSRGQKSTPTALDRAPRASAEATQIGDTAGGKLKLSDPPHDQPLVAHERAVAASPCSARLRKSTPVIAYEIRPKVRKLRENSGRRKLG
jgi:hypothetical protein